MRQFAIPPAAGATLLLVAGLLVTGKSQAAATILIWPIDPWLSAERNATELWIENQGTATATMQVRIVRWRQENGYERYEPQQEVVASPPILNVAQDDKQLIRLIKQAPAPAGVEKAYRIIVDEIPEPNDTSKPQMGLRLQMRYSIPLFVYGEGIKTFAKGEHHALVDTQKLRWRVVQEAGKPMLEISNRDAVHLRLSNVLLHQSGRAQTVAQGLLGYVLPGESRRWPLAAGITHPNEMTATINARDAKWHSAPGD